MLKDKQENSEKRNVKREDFSWFFMSKKHPKDRYKNSNNWEKISAAFTKDFCL